jgi:hypothetical protein
MAALNLYRQLEMGNGNVNVEAIHRKLRNVRNLVSLEHLDHTLFTLADSRARLMVQRALDHFLLRAFFAANGIMSLARESSARFLRLLAVPLFHMLGLVIARHGNIEKRKGIAKLGSVYAGFLKDGQYRIVLAQQFQQGFFWRQACGGQEFALEAI